MKQNKYQLSLIGFGLILTIAACARTTQPITNPSSVETALASTARALAKQTETANPITATPSLTPTETLTPTPKISLNGTSLVIRDDQSALFTDHELGFQLTIPTGWLPVRINEDEYYKAFTLDIVLENPTIVDFMTKIQNQDSNYVRLTAIDIQPGHVVNGMISGITVVLQPDNEKTLEEWAKVKPSGANQLQGYQLLSSQFQQTASGTRILVWERSWDSTMGGKIYSKRIFFGLPAGILTINFETDRDSKDALLPDFEQVVNNFTLLNP
jgi:hypothetical protein